jgi:hypothetical protein
VRQVESLSGAGDRKALHEAGSAMTNLMKSAFSSAVHMRPNTSLQSRLNRFSTRAGLLKRWSVSVGAH